MKKYRFTNMFHIFNILFMIICIVLVLLSIYFKFKSKIILGFSLSSVLAVYGNINLLFSYSKIESDRIIQKDMLRKVSIDINEIRYIVDQSKSKIPYDCVGIYGINNKISVSLFTKDYKELISIVIERCEMNPNIKIDPEVIEMIKK